MSCKHQCKPPSDGVSLAVRTASIHGSPPPPAE
ncbi:unnamed protein product, partial [Rotaria magnacalcarata]